MQGWPIENMCVLAVILSLSHGFKNESEFHSEFQTGFNQNWLFLVEQSKNNKYMKFNTIYSFIPSFLHKKCRFFYHPPPKNVPSAALFTK